MARPALSLGISGSVYYNRTAHGWRARCYVRDHDGRRRQVERWRKSKAAAAKALGEALRDRFYMAHSEDITPDSKFSVVAELWYSSLSAEELSPNTLEGYRRRLDMQIIPALGELRLREITVGVIDRHLKTVTTRHGGGTAKMCRSVLSGVFGLAVRHDAVDRNPIRDAGKIKRTAPKKAPRSLSLDEARQLIAYMTYHAKSARRDLFGLVMFMMATGLRIGEASAVLWDAIDLVEGTVEVRGTTVRLKGQGLKIKPSPKSPSGWRKLKLPKWAVVMLRLRCETMESGVSEVPVTNGEVWKSSPAFPAPMGGLRDPSNTQADLRELFDFCGGEDLTSHTFRKTVASLMDEAGLPTRAASDQLGHSNVSLTQDYYFGRFHVRDTGAAAVLEALAA
jgi:integrase